MKRSVFLVGLILVVVAMPGPSVSASRVVTPLCLGKEATIVGTAAAETIRGTAGDDVIVGGGSDGGGGEFGDEIFGFGGDDLICADPHDELTTLTYGGSGNDHIRAIGNLYGGPGNDSLFEPVDRGVVVNLIGGKGNDVLQSRARELNVFVPGPGDDTVLGAPGVLFNVVLFGGARRGVVVDLQAGRAFGQGHDVLDRTIFVFGSKYADVMFGDRDRINVLYGGRGGDVLTGGGVTDFVAGGRGTDRVDGGRGNDELVGGPGPDMLFGRAGNDQLTEQRPEPNLIFGGAGKDNCSGGYRIPPNLERGCETHRKPPPDAGGVGRRLDGLLTSGDPTLAKLAFPHLPAAR